MLVQLLEKTNNGHQINKDDVSGGGSGYGDDDFGMG